MKNRGLNKHKLTSQRTLIQKWESTN